MARPRGLFGSFAETGSNARSNSASSFCRWPLPQESRPKPVLDGPDISNTGAELERASGDWVRAVLTAATVAAVLAEVEAVEFFHKSLDGLLIIGHEAGFEVALAR